MIDTDFYIKSYEIQKAIEDGQKFDKEEIYNKLEALRKEEELFVYNIETTNACNMKCKMCPRTTMMTRPISTIDMNLFRKIVDQLKPVDPEAWRRWENFIEKTYGIPKDAMAENHFFLHIIPKVIQLHGYGDPLLDPNINEFVRILTERGFETYFSCNPSNIDIESTLELFKNGLSYIKYSIESIDDEKHKEIRGYASNFTQSYEKILKLIELKKQLNLKTTIIITMIDLGRADQKEEYQKLKKVFEGQDVYIYLKSEDQQWYRKDFHGTNSIHWSEFCKHPWMSMTIKSNGEVAMCMEDFNNEIILGDARYTLLRDIWNGEAYEKLRQDHINCNSDIKCTGKCDMCLVGDNVEKDEKPKKKKIIVTGSRGLIGRELVKGLQQSYEVIELSLSLGHDLRNEEFVKKFFKENKADYLVNLFALNHHIDNNFGEKSTLLNIPLESFKQYLDLNIVALFSTCREFARNNTSGGIINFSSIYGLRSPIPSLYENNEKHIGYGVSKAGIIQLTKHLASHLAPNIRVNCVVPGGIEDNQPEKFKKSYSDRTPLKRMMKSGEELLGIIEYLCSDKSSYATGAIFVIDGGWTIL